MTAIGARSTTSALVFLLGAAVFLNYVDRGAIGVAAPLMKPELGLSARPSSGSRCPPSSGSMRRSNFSSAGCATAGPSIGCWPGVVLWAVSTMLMGFAGGFASLLVLRLMLGVGESIAFPAQLQDHCPAVPPERAAWPMPWSRSASRLARRSERWPAA